MQQLRASSPNVYLRKVFGHAGARVEVSGPPLFARSSGQHLASAGASTSATSGRHAMSAASKFKDCTRDDATDMQMLEAPEPIRTRGDCHDDSDNMTKCIVFNR